MRFDLVLWYGEYSIQENNNLHLVSIWGKCSHYCLFLRWANVEFSSLPSLKEEISGIAGSSPCQLSLGAGPGCPLPWQAEAVLHSLPDHSRRSWLFVYQPHTLYKEEPYKALKQVPCEFLLCLQVYKCAPPSTPRFSAVIPLGSAWSQWRIHAKFHFAVPSFFLPLTALPLHSHWHIMIFNPEHPSASIKCSRNLGTLFWAQSSHREQMPNCYVLSFSQLLHISALVDLAAHD